MVIALSLLFFEKKAEAQTHLNKHISWWPVYKLDYIISGKWKLENDIQARNLAKDPLVGLIALRTGITYAINEHWSTTGGVAWFFQQQTNDDKLTTHTNEFRVWENLKNRLHFNRWILNNQFRIEQRKWLGRQSVALRLGYRLGGEYSISKTWRGLAGNEILWQTYRSASDWDQIRSWVGGGYVFNDHFNIQVLMMDQYRFQNRTHQPVVRINFNQTIN